MMLVAIYLGVERRYGFCANVEPRRKKKVKVSCDIVSQVRNASASAKAPSVVLLVIPFQASKSLTPSN